MTSTFVRADWLSKCWLNGLGGYEGFIETDYVYMVVMMQFIHHDVYQLVINFSRMHMHITEVGKSIWTIW